MAAVAAGRQQAAFCFFEIGQSFEPSSGALDLALAVAYAALTTLAGLCGLAAYNEETALWARAYLFLVSIWFVRSRSRRGGAVLFSFSLCRLTGASQRCRSWRF